MCKEGQQDRSPNMVLNMEGNSHSTWELSSKDKFKTVAVF